MMYDELKSEDLMPLIASGDERAFACLMARHRNAVYGIVYRFFKSTQEADDVYQEVFLKVWRSAGRYKPTAKFSTWLYTVTANHCQNELSSFWRRNIRLVASFWTEEAEKKFTQEFYPEEATAYKEQAAQVRQAINALPAKQRLALILSQFEDLPYKEIANIMNTSVAAVESLLFRAKQGLKKHL